MDTLQVFLSNSTVEQVVNSKKQFRNGDVEEALNRLDKVNTAATHGLALVDSSGDKNQAVSDLVILTQVKYSLS